MDPSPAPLASPPAVHDRPERTFAAAVVLGAVGAVGLVLTGSRLGALPGSAWGGWWFTVPRAGTDVLGVAFYLCALAMVVAWLGVGRTARAGGLSTTRALVVLAAWGLPLLVGPPLFSRDIYSYIGQGLLAHHGLDPYRVGPDALGQGPLLSAVASVWRATPAPYGPLFVVLAKVVTGASGGSLVGQVMAQRLLEVVGLALVVHALPRLARRVGADPGMALWLGVLSPLALFSFVASGHNDALMLGLLLLGVVLSLEGRPVVGLVLCSLAAAVKLPAAAAIVFLAVAELRVAPRGRRLAVAVPFVVVPVATVVLVTLASGLGWAWLGPMALRIPSELRVLTTPAVSIGVLVAHVLHGVGLPVHQAAVVTVTQTLCGTAGLVAAGWLLLHSRRTDLVQVLALALLVVVLTGPTLWPWYLLWGVVLLAATPLQRSRLVALVAALAMLVVGPSGSPVLLGNAYLLVTAGVGAVVVWLVRGGRWRSLVTGRPSLAGVTT